MRSWRSIMSTGKEIIEWPSNAPSQRDARKTPNRLLPGSAGSKSNAHGPVLAPNGGFDGSRLSRDETAPAFGDTRQANRWEQSRILPSRGVWAFGVLNCFGGSTAFGYPEGCVAAPSHAGTPKGDVRVTVRKRAVDCTRVPSRARRQAVLYPPKRLSTAAFCGVCRRMANKSMRDIMTEKRFVMRVLRSNRHGRLRPLVSEFHA